jgi:two-component system chemotaxis response regulator CheY
VRPVAAKIMIVDDAAFMREILKNLLKSEGYDVVAEAANGLEAVQRFKQYRPELVTMDITMPEMDGIEALTEIIRLDPQARVIMCTAMGSKSMVLDAMKAGAKDFMIKPFLEERVLQAVKKSLVKNEDERLNSRKLS